ncbi:MAG: 1-acyl-sn-glycerol-3-phosphate acyltransferase [Flavobacterium sp.]|nr:1-acyl-sn-glycerol-3-phosphate acyltransferase [Flavobacterium sp.]
MHQFFIKIHLFVQQNKRLATSISIVLLLVFAFFASKIKFEEDITRILPKNDQTDVTAKVLKQLKFSDKISVIIEKNASGTTEDLTEMASVFLDSVASCKPYIKDIQGVINEENIGTTSHFVMQNLPLFLEHKDYAVIAQKVNKDSIKSQVENNYKTLISPTGIVARDFIVNDPLGLSFIALKKLQQLNLGDDFVLKDGFLITKDASKLLLFLNPKYGGSETEKNTEFVAKLESIKQHLNQQFKGKTNVDYFGSSLIAVANAKQIKSDILATILVSLTTLMVVLIVYFRKLFIPVILFIPTLFGVLAAIAGLYFIKGTISAISLSVGAVLLGVTIDYSLHIMTHYRHNSNIQQLYKDIAKPLLMSSSTTAIAFLCLLFVNSEALKDLGIFACISVMVSAFFSLLLIPHLYNPKEASLQSNFLDKLSHIPFEKNKFLIIVSVILIVVSSFTFHKVTFNNNLSELNFIPSEIQLAEKKLESSTNLASKSIYLATYGNSMEEVLQKNNLLFEKLSKYKNANEVLNFSSIGGFIHASAIQKEKIEKWKQFWSPEIKNSVRTNLIQYGSAVGFKPQTHDAFYKTLDKAYSPIDIQAYKALHNSVIEEYVTENNGFYTVASVVKVSEKQRDNFVSKIGNEKNVIVIDRQQMNETFLGRLRDDFNHLINYSFIAVVFILFIFFKRIELVLISLIPIVITGVVTAGLMSIFNIQLNIFSTIVCTLIFGHGVDFTIFMTSALQKEYTTGRNEMPAYRVSIILAAITTILAIGALIFAKHPALISISSVSLIGVFAALLITFVFYPIVFRFFFFSRPNKGNQPITIFKFIHSVFSLLYYSLGGILLSTIGRFLVRILPGNPENKMLAFRKLMAKFVTSVLYSNPFVKKQVLNPNAIDFKQPAIVIANHTSVLDTLALGMVTHKIVYLVNDWVYNSPVFGKAVKAMGYYPVSQGIEGGVDHLREKVKEGYSLMVFPEGTRSDDNGVKRFHKGAFFLANELHLDVLPIYIHGNAETAPKGDFMIHNESISVVVGNYIKATDSSFGENYTSRTKKINKVYREQFAAVRAQLEDENFFKKKLFASFLYKEEEVTTAVKSDFEARKSLYYHLNKVIVTDAKICHIANNYGQIDFLIAINEPKRKIETLITNSEKRDIAANSYLVHKRVMHYVSQISESFQFHTLLISDERSIDFTTLNLPETCVQIILLTNFNQKNQLINLGFSISLETNEMVIFNK